MNTTIDQTTVVDFVLPLANLRPKMIAAMGGIAIGISPTDLVLKRDKTSTINSSIRKVMTKYKVPFMVIGEWSDGKDHKPHRWHYHGFIKVKDMKQLDKVKRALNNIIGRTVTEQIHNENYYLDYMLKCYETPYVLNTIQPFQEDSIVTNITNL